MQFQVPQNVQREDTIIGSVTFKQLGILMIGGFLTWGLYIVLNASQVPFSIWIGPVVILGLLTLAFAFLKYKDLTFLQAILFLLEYKFKPQKRYWHQGSEQLSVVSGKKPKSKTEKADQLNDRERRQKLLEISKQLENLPH